MPSDIPIFLIAGPVQMDFYLLPDGKTHSRLLSGAALHAASGVRCWEPDGVGLLSRVGNNFSGESLEEIRRMGIDISGIRILPDHPPSLGFYYLESADNIIDWDPVKYFAKHGIPCPADLWNYSSAGREASFPQRFPEIAIRRDDIPAAYRQARAVYIAPCHYQSQITLCVSLRQSGAGTILLSPPNGLLLPSNRSQIHELLHGIDILFAREGGVRALFDDRSADAATLSESLARWGPSIVVLQKGLQGVLVYDSGSRKYVSVPFYPVEMKNPVFLGDSFCGGFLARWKKTYSPLESALAGCVSASLAAEGYGGLFALQRNPGLAEARIASLRQSVAE